ncbi:MBL fold metallo-hydrolase [Arenibacterium sp. CAU 1754]
MTALECLTGRPVSLTILDYGLFRVHSGPRDIGIMGALIRTDADEQVLVDTGFPPKYTEDPAVAGREDRLDAFGQLLTCTAQNRVAAQLALAGSALDKITLMVQTHTHIDHVGGMADCPQAQIVIGACERALDRPLYWGDVRPMTWPGRSYALIERDTRLGPGLEVLLTPGHSPGQLALRIDLPHTGPVLWTSDAISRPGEIDEGFAGAWDSDQARHQAQRLMTLADRSDATVIYGHCPDQWKTLRKAPHSFT